MGEIVLATDGASGEAFLAGIGLALVGVLLVIASVRRLITAVSLSRSDATPVRDVPRADGPVEFEGTAEPRSDDGAFDAPFSGEPTLCCEVWVEVQRRRRDDVDGLEVLESAESVPKSETEKTWRLAESGDLRRPFAVRAGGGRIEVDPTDADLDVTGHMGTVVSTVEAGQPVSDEVRDRLGRLAADDAVDFDADPEAWLREDDRVRYREARLEPGETVHVAGGTVESVPEEWGSAVDATVGAKDDGRFTISEGTESAVVRDRLVQFATGLVVGSLLIGLGLLSAGVI